MENKRVGIAPSILGELNRQHMSESMVSFLEVNDLKT
jgi:hypothetical protein